MFEFRANNDGARTRRVTDIRKYSFTVRVVETWNQLPDSVKQAADKEAFKRDMKNLKLATAQSGDKKQQ